MDLLSRLSRPAVQLLGASTDLVLRLLGARPQKVEAISDDEVKALLQDGMRAGVFDAAEPRMVESVLSFDQQPVQAIMTPREKLVFLNQDDPHEVIWHKIVVSGYANYPVYEGSRDRVMGVVSVKAIYANLAAGVPVRLADLMVPPLLVPATRTITALLEQFRQTRRHIALVTDASGAVAGLVTLVDVLEAIVGEMPSLEERLKPEAVRRDDGTLLVDGAYSVARLAPLLGDAPLAGTLAQRCETLAAFAAAQLGPAAKEGAFFVRGGVRVEIIDMDGSRIDKVLLSREGGAS
jgi:putative hemolysin